MADVPIRDFVPFVLQYAPSLPVPVAVEHIRQAAIRFCAETRCWRHTTAPIAITANPTSIPVPINAVVHEIEAAEFEGIELEPAALSDFSLADLAAPAGSSPPSEFTQEHLDEIILMPLMAGNLTLRLFLKPPAGVDMSNAARLSLPDFMLNHHATFLGFGALSTALALPDETFTDPGRSSLFATQFQARIDAMKSGFRRGQQRRRPRTRRSAWL